MISISKGFHLVFYHIPYLLSKTDLDFFRIRKGFRDSIYFFHILSPLKNKAKLATNKAKKF